MLPQPAHSRDHRLSIMYHNFFRGTARGMCASHLHRYVAVDIVIAHRSTRTRQNTSELYSKMEFYQQSDINAIDYSIFAS